MTVWDGHCCPSPLILILTLSLILISTVATLGIAAAIGFLAFKYRKGSKADRHTSGHSSIVLEATWIGIPFVLMMATFVWGGSIYFRLFDPPDDARDVHVVG